MKSPPLVYLCLLFFQQVPHATYGAVIEVTAGGSTVHEPPTFQFSDLSGNHMSNLTAVGDKIRASGDLETGNSNSVDELATRLDDLATRLTYVGARMYCSSSCGTLIDSYPVNVGFDAYEYAVNVDTTQITSNSRFLPNRAGYYSCTARVWNQLTQNENQDLSIYKNGFQHTWSRFWLNAAITVSHHTGGDVSHSISDIVYLNGSSDYLELKVTGYNSALFGNTAGTAIQGRQDWTYMSCYFIGA